MGGREWGEKGERGLGKRKVGGGGSFGLMSVRCFKK